MVKQSPFKRLIEVQFLIAPPLVRTSVFVFFVRFFKNVALEFFGLP